ncbi:MAG: head-tail connector protein [Salinarimonas sp.]
MIPIRIAGPAVEPVSLAEARAFLRLDDDDTQENDLVLALIEAGRLLLESATRLIFVAQNWRLTVPRIRGQGIDRREIRLPLAPIIAISEVRALDEAGLAEIVDPALYRLRQGAVPPLLVLGDDFPGAPGGIEIDLQAGFGPDASHVPAPLRQALRMLVARWFEQRGDGQEPASTELPADVALMIAPYRHVRLQ